MTPKTGGHPSDSTSLCCFQCHHHQGMLPRGPAPSPSLSIFGGPGPGQRCLRPNLLQGRARPVLLHSPACRSPPSAMGPAWGWGGAEATSGPGLQLSDPGWALGLWGFKGTRRCPKAQAPAPGSPDLGRGASPRRGLASEGRAFPKDAEGNGLPAEQGGEGPEGRDPGKARGWSLRKLTVSLRWELQEGRGHLKATPGKAAPGVRGASGS